MHKTKKVKPKFSTKKTDHQIEFRNSNCARSLIKTQRATFLGQLAVK